MLDTSTNLSKVSREQMVATLTDMKALHPEQAEALNQILTFVKSQKYGLNFEKHIEQVDIDLQNHLPVFKPFKQIENGSPEDGYNFLLEGDNLHSLKLLEKTHTGAVDVIYIDPPYNTGNRDFRYNDRIIGEDDGYRHSKWLSFMSERLSIAKNLLSDTGVIFISIDDNEQARLKILCDEIFGEDNCVNVIIPEMASSGVVKRSHKDKHFMKTHEYVLMYSKTKSITINSLYDQWETYDKNYNLFFDGTNFGTLSDQIAILNTDYKKLSTDKYLSFGDIQEFVINHRKEIFRRHSPSAWAKKNVSQGELLWEDITKKTRNQVIKVYDDAHEKYELLMRIRQSSGWGYERLEPLEWNYHDGKLALLRGDIWKGIYRDMSNINNEGAVVFKNGKKPVRLVKDLIRSVSGNNALVLDFFAGSGTTGQAVLELNEEDSGNRHFILCTNNEIDDASVEKIIGRKPRNTIGNGEKIASWHKQAEEIRHSRNSQHLGICQSVTFPRINTVITGIRPDGSKYSDGIHCNLKYFQTDMVEKYERDDDGNYLPYVSETLRADLSNYIETLIELQDGISLPSERTAVVWDSIDIDELMESDTSKLQTVYMDLDTIETSAKQERFINRLRNHGVEFRNIPKYYYKEVA